MHCSLRLIVQTLVFSRSYLHRQVSPPETLVVKGGTTWARNGLKMPHFHVTFRDLLHAVNLRHGTNGFTSLPKEGVLRIFFALKNPRTWVPKASTLPIDHRSRYENGLLQGLSVETSDRDRKRNFPVEIQRSWYYLCTIILYILDAVSITYEQEKCSENLRLHISTKIYSP